MPPFFIDWKHNSSSPVLWLLGSGRVTRPSPSPFTRSTGGVKRSCEASKEGCQTASNPTFAPLARTRYTAQESKRTARKAVGHPQTPQLPYPSLFTHSSMGVKGTREDCKVDCQAPPTPPIPAPTVIREQHRESKEQL